MVIKMNKSIAKTPPLGWNSWDCFGAAVNENQLKANADYMAKHLKPFGWEYIVCDIQWYEPKAKDNNYNNFTELCMDKYGRLIPAENRFPSAKGGKGFKPIADYVHSLGLKFGIHIMRGVPRQAVHQNLPIKNCRAKCRDIAHHFSVCSWNTDMYGCKNTEAAQAYYNSIFELYAQWGVDFIKCDDICVTEFRRWDNPYSAAYEIEMIKAKLLYYYMQNLFKYVIEQLSAKSTVDSVRLNMIQDFVVCIPSIKEQIEIVNFIDKEFANIEKAIQISLNQISLLQERKQIIINDVVTGKVKVV